MYTITWEDFDRMEEHCELVCVEARWEKRLVSKWVCHDARSGSLSVPPVLDSPSPASSVRLTPVDMKGRDCGYEQVLEDVYVCVRTERQCGPRRVVLGDADLIDLTIESPSVSGLPSDIIEVVLESGPRVDWWKGALIYSSNLSCELWNKRDEDVTTQSARVSAEQFRAANWIEFKKAKVLGVHTGMYLLYDLHRIAPGSRVRFTWVRDQ